MSYRVGALLRHLTVGTGDLADFLRIDSFALCILLLKEHLHPTKALAVIGLLTGVFLLA